MWRARTTTLWLGLAAGCGRISFDPLDALDDSTADAAPLTINAGPGTAMPFTRIQLVALVGGAPTTEVTWAIESGGGSITATGEYAAPMSIDSATVRATSTSDPSVSATAVVQITFPQIPAAPVASVGVVGEAIGMAHQTHLVRTEAGEWWLWYLTSGDTTHIYTRHTTDFVTWSDGARLSLPRTHSNDGRNIDLAYRRINGVDVVHGTVGFIDAQHGRYHVKATLTPGSIAFGAPVQTNVGGSVEPDGPAVAILDSGLVIDGSGWDATPATPPLSPCGDGDLEMYTSAVADTGATSFDTMTFTKQVRWCAPVRINARQLIADVETLYTLFDDGLSDPNPANLLFTIRRPDGTWLPDETIYTMPPRVFATDSSYNLNDWSVARLGPNLHAIRRTGASTWDHSVFVLGSEGAWSPGAPLQPQPANSGSGVVLVPYGTGLLAMSLSTLSSSIVYAFFDGTTWSPWIVMINISTARIAAGDGGPDGRPAVLWQTNAIETEIWATALP